MLHQHRRDRNSPLIVTVFVLAAPVTFGSGPALPPPSDAAASKRRALPCAGQHHLGLQAKSERGYLNHAYARGLL